MLLNERLGWSSFLVFLLNINSSTYSVKSGLIIVFHWKAQLLITVLDAVNHWKKRDVSSTKSLQFEGTDSYCKLRTIMILK